jgi:hypothetical protein
MNEGEEGGVREGEEVREKGEEAERREGEAEESGGSKGE